MHNVQQSANLYLMACRLKVNHWKQSITMKSLGYL